MKASGWQSSQPEAFSTLSYISVWATWIWALTFVFCFVVAILGRRGQGLSAKGWIRFVFKFLFSNFLAYFLLASMAMFSRVLALIFGLVVAGFFLVGDRKVDVDDKKVNASWQYWRNQRKKEDAEQQARKKEEERKENRRRWLGLDS